MLALDRQPGSAGDTADLPLRQIIGAALAHGSQGLILAHNHPSGDASPSRADLDATRRLADTAASLGIRVHDHLIFAGRDCRSLRAMGLL
jgi:DNA repair protein RadC